MKDNRTCYLVKDLLPLFMDRLTCKESEELITSHLQTCPKCAAYYESLKEERNEALEIESIQYKGMKRLLRRYRFEMLGFSFGILLVILVIAFFIASLFIKASDEPSYSVSEHFEEAQDYGKQNYTGISALALFPDRDNEAGEIVEFYYDCKGNTLYQNYQIYLKCHYTPSTYEAEKNRLKNIIDPTTQTAVVYTEDEFDYPGVYAMLYDEGYEYALFLDEDDCIIYIYLQGMDRRNLVFGSVYLPFDYGQFGYSFETEREAFRIYPENMGGIVN